MTHHLAPGDVVSMKEEKDKSKTGCRGVDFRGGRCGGGGSLTHTPTSSQQPVENVERAREKERGIYIYVYVYVYIHVYVRQRGTHVS